MSENPIQRTDEDWDALIAEEQRQKKRDKYLIKHKRLYSENPEGQSRRARDGWALIRSEVEKGDDGRPVCIVTTWQTESGFFLERRNPTDDTIVSLTRVEEEDEPPKV